ncbi:hypothetical protein JJV70_15305 [Streptomyces sp. JJ66]|uniref:hypothetical protein n=1 Tax=Streptomyces sp. JJ66 TaxID=2803843 RepID=UPI001C5779BA|nr:hypothetical protein [Streptomyces sp. JJ66]MBW1603447.1 hypothetical protein [Streptomyces sp. JJ66]
MSGRITSRPECDGTAQSQTRNCGRPAVWQLKHPEDATFVYGACALHLHQVGTYLLDGEMGDLHVRRIRTEDR